MTLRNQVYSLLDSVLIGEYDLLTRCHGLLLLLSEDLPDGQGLVDGLSEDEVVQLTKLVQSWEGLSAFAQSSQAFLAAGMEPGGHRVLAWGWRSGQGLVVQAWAVWLGQERLPATTSSRAATFAHQAVETLMEQGIIKPLQAPLHFGWREEGLDSLHFCALSALDAGLFFPQADLEELLKARLHHRGFGFALRDDRLIWLVVEDTSTGFNLTAFGYQQPEGSANFGQVVQA